MKPIINDQIAYQVQPAVATTTSYQVKEPGNDAPRSIIEQNPTTVKTNSLPEENPSPTVGATGHESHSETEQTTISEMQTTTQSGSGASAERQEATTKVYVSADSAQAQYNEMLAALRRKKIEDEKAGLLRIAAMAASPAAPEELILPTLDVALRNLIFESYDGYDELPNLSRFGESDFHDLATATAGEVLARLFPKWTNERKILCGWKIPDSYEVKTAGDWGTNIEDLTIIVPNAVPPVLDGPGALIYLSHRPLCRNYLVIRFPGCSLDQQAALLLHLSKYLDMPMIVHSESSLLEGWFDCCGLEGCHILRVFIHQALALGADPATWSKAEPVALPCGKTKAGGINRVVYFDREAIDRWD